MRVTLSNLKASRIPAVLNVSPDDPRFTAYLNEACERIFFSGENFFDLTQKFAMCVYNGCLTFPRRVAAIESLWACNTPITIRNQWFENLDSGPLLQTGNGGCNSNGSGNQGRNPFFNNCGFGNSYDRGTACTFQDIRGLNKKIRVYADVAEAADAVITLQGYDENGIWIRTQVDGEWIDGEQVAISTTPTVSTKLFSNLVAVQKPVTNGNVRLYEYNTDTTDQRAIAVYEPSETNPSYRRSFIPGLENARCCDTNNCDDDSEDSDTACRRVKVTAIARLEFVPVSADSDWVIPGNIPALKDMMQAVRFMEMNDPVMAAACSGRAFDLLRRQLRHYLGHAVVQPVRRQASAVGNPGPALNIM